jgi:hypothetical protein
LLFGSGSGGGEEETKDDNGGKPIHMNAMITGMDVCARKPLVVTCGVDRCVRVWNYLTHHEEVNKYFPEDALSVSFHPSGLHVLVGFSDKLRLMNLLMDDIRVVTEFPIKGCRECQFSDGGQTFAAANGHSIQLYRTYTAEPIALLRGHNSKVQSLHWTQHDTRLVSAGKDGAVYQWDVTEGGSSDSKKEGGGGGGFKREGEYVLKGCSYTHAISNIDGTLVYAVGSDSQIKEIEFQGTMTNATNPVSSDIGVFGQLAMPRSGRLLFSGRWCGEWWWCGGCDLEARFDAHVFSLFVVDDHGGCRYFENQSSQYDHGHESAFDVGHASSAVFEWSGHPHVQFVRRQPCVCRGQ